MSKENKYNELEQFFRSRLRNPKVEPEAWNVPDDDILSGAFAAMDKEVKEEKKKGFPLMYILAPLLLFVFTFLAFIIFNQSKQVENLNKELAHIKTQQNTEQVVASEDAQINKNIQTIAAQEEALEANQYTQSINADAAQNLEDRSFTRRKHDSNNSFAFSQKVNNPRLDRNANLAFNNDANYFIGKTKETSIVAEEKASSTFNNNIIAKAFELSQVGPKPMKPLVRPLRILTLNSFLEEKESTSTPSKWRAYMSVGHLYSSFKMNAISNANYTLEDYDKYYNGIQFLVGSTYSVNEKFSLSFDLGFRGIHNKSTFTKINSYDSANEFYSAENELMYRASFDITSPLGLFSDEMELKMDGIDMSEGDPMKNKTNIHQILRVANLSTALNYELFSSGNTSLNASVGLSFNRLFEARHKMTVKMYDGAEEMDNKLFQYNDLNLLRPFFWESNIGLNLRRDFANNIFLNLGANYHRSLHSLTRANANNAKTTLHGFNSSISIGYTF